MESKFLKFGQKVKLCRYLSIYLTYEPQKPSNVRNILCKTYRIGSCGPTKSKNLEIGLKGGWWRGISQDWQILLPTPPVPLYIYLHDKLWKLSNVNLFRQSPTKKQFIFPIWIILKIWINQILNTLQLNHGTILIVEWPKNILSVNKEKSMSCGMAILALSSADKGAKLPHLMCNPPSVCTNQ